MTLFGSCLLDPSHVFVIVITIWVPLDNNDLDVSHGLETSVICLVFSSLNDDRMHVFQLWVFDFLSGNRISASSGHTSILHFPLTTECALLSDRSNSVCELLMTSSAWRTSVKHNPKPWQWQTKADHSNQPHFVLVNLLPNRLRDSHSLCPKWFFGLHDRILTLASQRSC